MKIYGPFAKRNVSIKLVLACMLWHAMAANGYRLRHASSSLKFPSWSFSMDRKGFFGPGVIFGSCQNLALNKNKTSCFFGMETASNVGSPEHVRYCNFTHTTRLDDKHRRWGGLLDEIVAIDEDKAVFTFSHAAYADLSIIHFSDCKVIPVDVTGVTRPNPGAPFDGTFDIFSFKKGKKVRAVVDFKGNIIKGQGKSEVPIYVDAVVRSPAKGYLVVRADVYDGQIEVLAYNDQGPMEVLKRYIVDQPTVPEVPSEKYTFSITHQLLSICGQRRSEIRCGQFDQNGVLKFEITIPFAESSNKYLFNAYNLQGGGLLFVSFRCVHERFYECSEIEDHINVTTFDDTGRQVGTMQIKEVEKFPADIRESRFFVNEKKEICLSSFDRCHEFGPCVTLNVVCFTGDELIPSKLK